MYAVRDVGGSRLNKIASDLSLKQPIIGRNHDPLD
jgi:hypothetical protein